MVKNAGYVILGIFFLLSCAPRQAQPGTPAPEEEEIIVLEETPEVEPETLITEEKPGTLEAEEGVIVFEEEEIPTVTEAPPTTEEAPPPVTEEAPMPPAGVKYGYRVQVGAFSTNEKAEQFASEARARFSDMGVYVEYIPPYYKVRIGDFLTRQEAETFKSRARSLGYYDAFIVESQVSPVR